MTTAKRMFTVPSVGFLIVVLLLATAPREAGAQETGERQPAAIEVAQHDEVGAHLVDAEGMSLYLFENDSEAHSTCYDACAEAWPPYIVEGSPSPGEGIDTELLSTMKREDGMTQVTYNGWPLYYFVQDTEPGDINGQDVEGFGAEWYLIGPDGEKVEEEGAAE